MEGYAKLAFFMGQHPESALVQRFSDINMQNILYLQAEIHGLREDLRGIEAQSQISLSQEFKRFSLDWYTLAETLENDKPNQQWLKMKQLRTLLRDYNEAVLQFHQMSKIASPEPDDINALQEWLRRPNLGAVYLTGRDRNIWADGVDLMCLGERPNTNPFTNWTVHWLLPKYHGLIGRHSGSHNNPYYGTNVAEYSNSGIAKVANLMGTVLASLLPVIAIVVLHLTKGTGVRLALVGIFSALFSTCLWLLNNGKVVEVFAATSAFAAVQVVFIGTNGLY